MRRGFVVPVYRHGSTLESVVRKLTEFNCPIIVVDDGNDAENREFIRRTAENHSEVVLVTREKNGGKGKAMSDGVRKAAEMGLTHILQIDSDGQHDAGRISHFWRKAEEFPEAVICGYPEYDESAPSRRVNGRKIANGWIHFVTLSKDIKDALIGFRVYPVAPYKKLLDRHTVIDARMGYDIDILVHLYWTGVPVISESVKITYPQDGISTFRAVRDNLRIAGTYSRLVLGMIPRLPVLTARKLRRRRVSGKK